MSAFWDTWRKEIIRGAALFCAVLVIGFAVHAAHSIYFQVMGEHGFIGLGLYLLLGVLTWRSAGWIARSTEGNIELRWAGSLATMIQTSMVGFAVGGAFLSLVYFDVPYYLMGAIVTTRLLVEQRLAEAKG